MRLNRYECVVDIYEMVNRKYKYMKIVHDIVKLDNYL